MNKILLIAINSRFSHTNLALYYLRTYIKDLDYNVKIIEFTINQEIHEILQNIIDEKPAVLAFSVYIWNVDIIKQLIQKDELYSESKIILGGPEVSYNAREWLSKYPQIDFIIQGHGEIGFYHVLKNNFTDSSKIINIPNPSFDEIPFPYIESDFNELKNRNIYYESSRGCPFKCSYCLSSRIDQKFELRDIKKVKDELAFLIKQKPKIIKFVDRTFNAKKEHSRGIWEYLIDFSSNYSTRFHFEIHPHLLDESDFFILSKCPNNLFQFEIGIQSINEITLKAVNRTHEWKEIKPKIQRLLEMKNIYFHLDMIAGLPYEDMERIRNSFNEIYNFKAHYFQMGFLKILPGTRIEEQISEYGLTHTKRAPYQILKNSWLNSNEINNLEGIADLLNRLYNSHKFELTIKNLEELYPSPFDLYSEFQQCKKNYVNSINQEVDIGFIIFFVKLKFAHLENFFIDCLRWDWCMTAKVHYYPELLKSDNTIKAKKNSLKFFNKFLKENIIKFNDIIFPLDDLKKSLFFMPESELMQKKYMNNRSMALFLSGEKRIIFFDL